MTTLIKKVKGLKAKLNEPVASYSDLMTEISGSDPSWKQFAHMTDDLKEAKQRLDHVKHKNAFLEKLVDARRLPRSKP